jgi:hypothetical protein
MESARCRIIAVCGIDVRIYGDHLPKAKLDQLAKATKASLIALARRPKHQEIFFRKPCLVIKDDKDEFSAKGCFRLTGAVHTH